MPTVGKHPVGVGVGADVLGSQRQPSLYSQVIASPSPATPLFPWSESRQYSPGS